MKFCMDITETAKHYEWNIVCISTITNISEVKPNKCTIGSVCTYVVGSSQSKTANNNNHSSFLNYNSKQ
jgi:hypothetical protein